MCVARYRFFYLYHFLNKIDSVYEIKRLFENFNNDKEVAYRYAQLIIKQPLYLQDRNLLAQLVDDYNLNEDEFLLTSKETSIKKDTYNIAVMLPFIVEKLQPNLYKKGNQFVIDVYDGAESTKGPRTKRN
mgnify:CR=1 FL=1